jgi:uncharacterized protein YndB with AHSA1/START domain
MLSENRFCVELARPTFVATRFFDAPCGLVFAALVEPEHLARWSGPRDFTQAVCEVDLWQGGLHRSVLQSPDGKELTFSGVYREVVPRERLVYTERFEVAPHSSHEHIVSIALDERGGGTVLTLTERLRSLENRRAKMKVGAWEANLHSLDRLAEAVESLDLAGTQDKADPQWALVEFECREPAAAPERLSARRRALERFAALFGARP